MTLRLLLKLFTACFCVSTAIAWNVDTYGPVPKEPDYNDSSQWFIRDKGGLADLFYIVSTETGDYLVGSDSCHFADTYSPTVSRGMLKEMRAVDSLFGGACNYYSPYYRQVTMQSWASESLAFARLPIALADVERSWEYYLKHFNQGRPFVIAGFSQGAHAMLEILKHMPDSVWQRMVAAYCIGYRIPQTLLDSFPTIRPAQGATDLGVTINYNSVQSPDCAIPIVSGGNVVCINPVNWRVDEEPATFGDTLVAHCDTASHLLIVDGYKSNFFLPVIGRPGNYHYRELKFYYPYLRQNIADRIATYLRRDE